MSAERHDDVRSYIREMRLNVCELHVDEVAMIDIELRGQYRGDCGPTRLDIRFLLTA